MNSSWPDKVIRAVGSVASLIVHTLIFTGALLMIIFGYEAATVMLILTTAVSLEAIYLSILIQMALNRQSVALAAVEEDVHEIQEDVEGIEEDVDEIQEDVQEIQEDVDEIQEEIVEEEISTGAPTASIEEIESDIAKLAERVASLKKKDN